MQQQPIYQSARPSFMSRLDGAPVTKWLLILNIAVYFLGMANANLGEWLALKGHFSVATFFQHGQLWRILSFQFLHASPSHLLFNMFAIYMFGAFVEHWWQSKKFLFFYLIAGCGGALLYSLLFQLGQFGDTPFMYRGTIYEAAYIPLVGASAGIYGILLGVAVIAPDQRIMLIFPPIPMKMRTFALGILAISLFIVLTDGRNSGGEAGHLGGAILGFIMMKNPHWLAFIDRTGGGPSRPAGGTKTRWRRPGIRDAKVVREKKIKPRTIIDLHHDDELDGILDKISEQGFQSLTAEERKKLDQASQKK